MTHSRRQFLQRGLTLSAYSSLAMLLPKFNDNLLLAHARDAGMDDLHFDAKNILHLHRQFQYRILQTTGEQMSDGYLAPGKPDGMGCFAGSKGGEIVLMRNHELDREDWSLGPYPHLSRGPQEAYDPTAPGGVTRLVVDSRTLQLKRSELAIAGTLRNCAGGHSPWGWMSCEETTLPGHGYTFVSSPHQLGLSSVQPIRSYGKMNHEACIVDAHTMVAYLTEDRDDSCFYRFVPFSKLHPFAGHLQALKIKGHPAKETSSNIHIGESFEVEWVTLPNINVSDAEETDQLRYEAQRLGAAIFRRGEGLCFYQGDVYFTCTSGGPYDKGQIFRYRTGTQKNSGRLQLITQSMDPQTLNMPDNIIMSPHGDLFIAEDGDNCHIRVLTRHGKIFTLAQNAIEDHEFTGVCFSPDGKTLFVNMQHEGLTLAITGPLDKIHQL